MLLQKIVPTSSCVQNLLWLTHQLVGGVAHGRDDDDDVVSLLLGRDDALGDPLDRLGVGDRRAAVLLHDPQRRP